MRNRLSFIEEEVLKGFSSLVEEEIPQAQEIVLFGSRARDKSDEDSDFDIAIIIDLPNIDKEIWDKVWDIKWRVLESLEAEEFPLSISLITVREIVTRNFGIEEVIKKEGIVIWKREN